jgi:hypothetical protein
MTYYQNNKELLKLQISNYKKQNIDYIREKNREYKKLNKDIIKVQQSIKIICVCNRAVTKRHLKRHLNSKIHINNV